MPAAEAKPLQMVVTHLIRFPNLEDTSALGALVAEQARPPSIQVVEVREQLPNSVEQPASTPSNTLNHLKTPPQARMWGLLHLKSLR
ncbi:hypothetical protein VULLAG_LOCUS23760 [Vulpes lagopus]